MRRTAANNYMAPIPCPPVAGWVCWSPWFCWILQNKNSVFYFVFNVFMQIVQMFILLECSTGWISDNNVEDVIDKMCHINISLVTPHTLTLPFIQVILSLTLDGHIFIFS